MNIRIKNKIIKAINTYDKNIVGVVFHNRTKCIFEHYTANYNSTSSIHIASVTKSITSLLLGIAIDQNYIQSIDQRVLDYFPGYTPKRREKNIQNVTIRQVMTMTAPYKYKSEPYTSVFSSNDWTIAALNLLGGKDTIGAFKYTTVGVQILSSILAKSVGTPVLNFAIKNVFAPLGIQPPHSTLIQDRSSYMSFVKDRDVSGWVVDGRLTTLLHKTHNHHFTTITKTYNTPLSIISRATNVLKSGSHQLRARFSR